MFLLAFNQVEKDNFVNNYVDATGYPPTKTYVNEYNNNEVSLNSADAALLDIFSDLHEWMYSDGQTPDLSHLAVTSENVRHLIEVGREVLVDRGENQYNELFDVCGYKLTL